MDLAALFSGGKDSMASVYISMKSGHKIKYLVTIFPENPESYMFHYPNIRLTVLQAKTLGIKHITRESKGEKEREVKDLEMALRPVIGELDGIVAGGIASNYQADRIGKICHALGLKFLTPLWHIECNRYWRMLLKSGFRVMVTGVYCQGLGEEWLGRVIDSQALKELKILSKKFRFHLGFEGGEAETFVVDAPIFKKKIKILKAKKEWDEKTLSGSFIIKKAKLIDK